MALRTWTLVDQEQNTYIDQLSLTPNDVGGKAGGYGVTKQTLRAGLSQGVDVIEVRHGEFRFTVVPTRGMGIWRAALGDLTLGWKSPVHGPVHPAFVHTERADGLGWIEGFDELLVRCGLESNGAPEFLPDGRLRYGLHGKIANIPAHKVEVAIDGDAGRIAVRGTVDEARLFGCKLRLETSIETEVGRAAFVVRDTVTNLSAAANDFELLYHINFGPPLVQPGAKVLLPIKRLAPRDDTAVEDLPTLERLRPGIARLYGGLLLHPSGGRRRREHASAAARPGDDAGRGAEIQPAAIALLHDLEEPRGGCRRLRDRPGAGDELSQHEVIREGDGPRRRVGAGRVASFELEIAALSGAAEVRAAAEKINHLQRGTHSGNRH